MKITVVPMEDARRADFFHLMGEEEGGGWCWCVAWWVPEWKTFADRSSEENRAQREALFDRGEFDGYLVYVDDEPAGWCQVGKRDRLEKLRRQYGLEPDDEAWAVTCFHLSPRHRGKGLAQRLLAAVLEDLKGRGVTYVQAFPKRGEGLPPGEVWTGPERLFVKAGFNEEESREGMLVYGIRL